MFEEILSKIGASLNKHKLPYMIIGGQAVLLYGEPRLTRDIERSPFVNYLESVYEVYRSAFICHSGLSGIFLQSRKHSGSAILLVLSERFPASGNDINVALLIAVLVTHCNWRSGCPDVSQFELCS